MKANKPAIEYEGKTYTLKSHYRKLGKMVFVCDTNELFGAEGDRVLAELVDAVYFSDGSVLVPSASQP